ncbi:hypothetical protein [Acinetobacter sp.]|uniref:hypothetical protein n=1 Tax=Acinetobacter sp. TaxID=472 RepID=UPI0028A59250|nr:hypothetical protein [Acinetobacter sp.]
MDNPIPFDISSKTDQTIWSAFNPLTQTMISTPSREEFERLYLCDWSASMHESRNTIICNV